jgi:hypothetical protein
MPRQRFPLIKFDWPSEIRHAIRKHVEHAVFRLSPERYEQEHAYVAALIARLDGLVYDGAAGRVEFLGTVVNDRGPNSAESRWGADFALTASLSQGERSSHKAVLGQAKRGRVHNLSSSERSRLDGQCSQMMSATSSCVILETPSFHRDEEPVLPTVQILGDSEPDAMTIADYFIDQFAVCLHGDRRSDFVIRASNSRLNSLHLSIESAGAVGPNTAALSSRRESQRRRALDDPSQGL